jgi:hypothetical protein
MPHPFLKIKLIVPDKYKHLEDKIKNIVQHHCDIAEKEIDSLLRLDDS